MYQHTTLEEVLIVDLMTDGVYYEHYSGEDHSAAVAWCLGTRVIIGFDRAHEPARHRTEVARDKLAPS